jgi:hypothetical protein
MSKERHWTAARGDLCSDVGAGATDAMKREPGTVAALVLGVLATIGSAMFGITNLETLFEGRTAVKPPSTESLPGST